METQQRISILSLAATGLLIGASPAAASPVLDSPAASFAPSSTAAAKQGPKTVTEDVGSHAETVKAIAAINAAPAASGSDDPAHGTQRGVGTEVSLLAKALHLAGKEHTGRQASARQASDDARGSVREAPPQDRRGLTGRYDFSAVVANAGMESSQATDPSHHAAPAQNAVESSEVPLLALLPTLPGTSNGTATPSFFHDEATAFTAAPVIEALAAVPEPATMGLLALGLAGMWLNRKRPA